MRKFEILAGVFMIMLASCSNPNRAAMDDSLFNQGWKFVRDSLVDAQDPSYDDSGWMTVDLPHDYSIMALPDAGSDENVGPFSRKSPGMNSTGHVMGGTGWYRKSFTVSPEEEGKRFTLYFDGAYMESTVWVNGKKMGVHHYGYTPFHYDITDALNPAGKENVIAVKVDNVGRNSRWYSGSGLYRNVSLIISAPQHFAVWGLYATTPEVSEEKSELCLAVTMKNDAAESAAKTLRFEIMAPDGSKAAGDDVDVNLDPSSETRVTKNFTISSPKLWSPEAPNLYKVRLSLLDGRKITDVFEKKIGIRSISFSADEGFMLNGKPVIMNGGCVHHDLGFLGAAAIRRAEYKKVETLKKNGYNAVRCSHNPPSEAFLDACDELGLLVIDEFTDMWNYYKNPDDYAKYFGEFWEADLTEMIMRDRNHPSVVMWSIGNEIPVNETAEGVETGKMLASKVKSLDKTRPVTQALTEFDLVEGWESSQKLAGNLDVAGYNYERDRYEADHEAFPDRIIVATETYPSKSWEDRKAAGEKPYVIGNFIWTAMDYIGETSIANSRYADPSTLKRPDYGKFKELFNDGYDVRKMFDLMNSMTKSKWPEFISWCGDIDMTGEKKPQRLYRDVLYDMSPVEINVHEPIPEGMVEVVSAWGWPKELPSWNWEGNEGKPMHVRVFTKGDEVSLLLNGREVGKKALEDTSKFIAEFEVPYEKGSLTAIAYSGGKEIGRKELHTAGPAAALRLTADRTEINADRNDLAYVKVEALDSASDVSICDTSEVIVSVSGDGEMVASGNADPSDMKSVNSDRVRLHGGRAMLIVRPYARPGEVNVEVRTEDGLSSRLTVKVR